MLKQIAWNTFKNTGDINTMMELMEVDKAMQKENVEKNEITKENNLENKNFNQNQWCKLD